MCVLQNTAIIKEKKDRKTEIWAFFVVVVIFVIALTSAIHLNCFSFLMLIIIICLLWKLMRTIVI